MLAKLLLPDGDYEVKPMCKNCYFGRTISDFHAECHANPPVVCQSPLEANEGNCTFPILAADNYCGRFERGKGPLS